MKLKLLISEAIQDLFKLSLKLDEIENNGQLIEFSKPKIIFFLVQIISIIGIGSQNIQLNNYLLFLAQFITFQYIYDQTHQMIVLIFIIIVHLIFIIASFNVKNIKYNFLCKILQFYFENYDWIFYIPSQTLCFKNLEFTMIVLSIIVIFLSSLQFLISIYIFRDSGFHTQYGRSETIIFSILFWIVYQTIIFLQLIDLPIWNNVKIFLTILLLIIKIFEFQFSSRFFDKNLQSFYQIAIIITVIFLCQQIFVINFNLQEDPYYYTLLLIFPLLNFFYAIDNQLNIDSEQFFKNILLRQNPKFAIIACSQIIAHKKNCQYLKCQCQKNIDINNIQHVIKFTNQLIKIKKPFNMIKYLYFQILYNNNGFKNFLQITKILKLNHNFSIYENNVINTFLNFVQKKTKKLYKEIIPNKFTEVVFTLQWFESNQEILKNKLNLLLSVKLNLWQQYLTDKIQNYDEIFQLVIEITSQIKEIKLLFHKLQNELIMYANTNGSLENNLFYLRVMQILEVTFYSVNKFSYYEKKIKKIIEYEQGQGDLLNYQMFENQKAMQIMTVLSEECRGKIQKVSNKWQYLEKTESLADFMPSIFYQIHDQLLQNYCKFGPQRPQIFQTFIKFCDTPLVSKVKICLNNFPNYDNEFLYQMGTIVKENLEENQDYILVNQDFTILGYSESLWFKIFQHIKFDKDQYQVQVFKFLPEIKGKLIEHYEAMQQYNLRFNTHEKIICHSFNSTLSLFSNVSQTEQKEITKYNQQQLPISPYERLQMLMKYQDQNVQFDQQINIQLTITEVYLKYQTKQGEKSFIYYWITLSFQDTKILDKQFNNQFSLDLKIKTDEQQLKKIQILQPAPKKSVTKTTSSVQQRSAEIFQFSEIASLISQISAFKLLILLSIVYSTLFLIGFILINLQIQKKQNQQTQCFDYLDYSTSFLDAYGRAMIASRHVIYLRDFNKFLQSSDIYSVDHNSTLNVTSVDKISFSLYIYKQSIEELVQFFQDHYDKLKLYDQNIQTVELKRINYAENDVELQTIMSLSQYYKIMITTLYMAIKSFAKDPTLYLKGTTDTWAQVNTRSILYFNFKNVANITLNFMIQCKEDDQMINNQLDQDFTILLVIFYATILFFLIIFTILYKIIKQKQRFVLSLFCRTSHQDGVEEIEFLFKLQDIIKKSKLWFGSYEDDDIEEIKPKKQYFGKQVKSHISDTTSNKSYWKFIIPLVILSYGSLIIIQINYIDYSTHLSPIVTATLQTQYIRLLFLDTINNWDVFVNRKFYKAMIDSYPTATGRYKIFSENIRHGHELLRLVNVDEEVLQNNIKSLSQEPFSEMIYSQTSSVDSNSLLSQDICLLSIFQCNMNQTVYKERVHYDKMFKIYEVGIINLFISSVQVMNENDFFSLTDNKEIIDAFERLEKSSEYFFYFLWGFDAFLYQMRLFSDYFINLSKNELSILSNSFYLLFYFITIITLLSVIFILIFSNLMIQQEFLQTIEILQQIPKSTIISKSLGKLIRQL